MFILTIVQRFVELPYLEITFLETSYLRIFELCRPIIYRPDELFQKFLQFVHLLIKLNILTPSSLGEGTTPLPIYLQPYVKTFTCKPWTMLML